MTDEARLYDIIETDRFQRDIRGVAGSLRRWDEMKAAVDFALARDPRTGTQIGSTPVWAMPLNSIPPITIYYTFNDDDATVYLEAAFVAAD